MCLDTKLVEFNIEDLTLYRKKKISAHYIESLDIAENGISIQVPTLEGIVEVVAAHDQYIMIGPCNDIYPISRGLFKSRYETLVEAPDEGVAGQIKKLGWNPGAVKKCRLSKNAFVYAKEVAFDFSVFVKHSNSFIYGKAGDFYAVTFEDKENRYIISSHVMKETYEMIERERI